MTFVAADFVSNTKLKYRPVIMPPITVVGSTTITVDHGGLVFLKPHNWNLSHACDHICTTHKFGCFSGIVYNIQRDFSWFDIYFENIKIICFQCSDTSPSCKIGGRRILLKENFYKTVAECEYITQLCLNSYKKYGDLRLVQQKILAAAI